MYFKTKAEAEREGREVLRKFFPKGEGWTLRVWENLGWHYAFRNGLISVFPWRFKPHHKLSFSCLIADKEGSEGCGAMWNEVGKHFDTPLAAVRNQIRAFEKMLAAYEPFLRRPEVARIRRPSASAIVREVIALAKEKKPSKK